MNRPRPILTFLVLLFTLVVERGAAETPSAASEGQDLAAELRSAPPPDDLEVTGFVRIRHSNGRRTSQPFRFRVVVSGDTWQHIYETLPVGSQPSETLVVTHRQGAAPQYQLTGPADATGKTSTVSLEGDGAMVPFAGSDFWLADLGLEFLHWPEQRIDYDTRLTMRKGRSCRVLESINTKPGAQGYTRVRSWVDIKTGGIIIAEAYGAGSRPAKEFEIGGFTKVNDRWELKKLEMRDLRADTRTVFEFVYEGRE
jgi:hypothetical protein